MREKKRISIFREWSVLSRQYISILWTDKKKLTVMFAFPVIAALITVWIAGEDMFVHYDGTKSAAFVLVSSAIWGGLFNSIQTIVKERQNVKRDYISGMRLSSYIASKALIQLILCLIQSAVLCLAFLGVEFVYGNQMPAEGIFFSHPMIEFYISLFLLMYAADMMGLCISAAVKKEETASVMAPYILIGQLIFSGILFSMEGIAQAASYIMISRWGMEALGSISNLNEMQLKIQLSYSMIPHNAEAMFEHSTQHLSQVWLILTGFIVCFFAVSILLLRKVSKDTR